MNNTVLWEVKQFYDMGKLFGCLSSNNFVIYIFFKTFRYCIVFELAKVTKACRRDKDFRLMKKGKDEKIHLAFSTNIRRQTATSVISLVFSIIINPHTHTHTFRPVSPTQEL